MHRIGVFLYGVFAYAGFLATFLYAMGFVGGFGVPRPRLVQPVATGTARPEAA